MAESDNVIREGKAKIFLNENIFYNPVQEFNRDMRYIWMHTSAKLVQLDVIFNFIFHILAWLR